MIYHLVLVLHNSVYHIHLVNSIPYTGCSLIFRLWQTDDDQGNSEISCSVNGYEVNSYISQFVLKSIRTHFGQFVFIFGQFVLIIKLSQFVLISVNSYFKWSTRTHIKYIIFTIPLPQIQIFLYPQHYRIFKKLEVIIMNMITLFVTKPF